MATPRRRLTPDDWAEAALAAIAEGGLAAVAVEPLAAQLGTTKGSFYWHFANRAALLDAALARWEKQTTTMVIGEIVEATDEPVSQLRRLIVRVISLAERDQVEPALQASAAHPAVARALDRVTRARIGLIETVFTRLGFPLAEARSRALLAYSAYLGHAQLAHSTPQLLPATADERRAYLDQVLAALTRPSGT
ncbi:TetR/AcrR family transcriptional regulator [Phytohabitans rumicis]|uniref:TetR family transcriptional regulator n=1 Tax=Phytohabitans rumicis TaxID=1076125 RepID=A0A6V8LGK2_9ACTN|nr:TetR/AcrR family transcriptional regulator [Phytohabitans rumicis]GFJ96373.1 TetR family transcriptional regulator [Phytohabitans rumicis]